MASSARLDELKKKFDENPRRYFAPLANEHRKSGDLDQAIALCRTHLPQQPGHISGHIVLAQALFEAGSLDESREIFHTALGLDPENLIALRYLGDIARDSSDVETARSWYQRVLEVDPRNDEIVQLVRELDSPRPVAEPVVEEPIEPESSFAPPPTPATARSEAPAAPVAPANSDARFAPLSLEEVDISDAFGGSESAPEAAPNEETAAPAHDTYDAHAAWSIGESTTELPMLDASGIDPFDLDPSASADALFDANATTQSADDFFLTELSGAGATADGADPEMPYVPETPETWSSAPPAEPAVTPNEQPSETTGAFEAGEFYLEPPPPEPAHAEVSDEVVAGEASTAGAVDAASEQVAIPGMDAFAAEYSTGSYEAIPEPEPNADSIERFASQATAEWHPPAQETEPIPAAASADDGLGLEVMEFVPPSSESQSPPTYEPAADADPMLGRTPSMESSEQSATPAAFVTETMAELYLQQGFRNEALAVYRELLSRNPADASLRDRIEQIENGSISSLGVASVSDDVVESALKRQTGRPARSVRSFFASLASRRAPAPREDVAAESPSASMVQSIDEALAYPEVVAAEDTYVLPESVSTPEPAQASAEPMHDEHPDRITPLMSAAESLSSFDPFADNTESIELPATPELMAPAPVVPAPQPAPNVAPAAFDTQAPAAPSRPTPIATRPQTPLASQVIAPEAPARRSLEDLFPDTPITARTEAAAQTLANAFGQPEPQGRPTRAASNELSLDHVFRGAPEGAPPADGGFSFDQFFSDSRASGGDVAAPATAAPETGRSSTGSGDAHDIEQFTAWLEGLKKK